VFLDDPEVGLEEFLHDVAVDLLDLPLDATAVVEVIHDREKCVHSGVGGRSSGILPELVQKRGLRIRHQQGSCGENEQTQYIINTVFVKCGP